MKQYSRARAIAVGACVAAATVLAATTVSCSSDSSSDTSNFSGSSAVAPNDPGSDDVSGGPERIISLSPTHTEILFAIGAGDRVVAVDSMSNHPPEAADVVTALSGFEPNVESIVSYVPDLVVIGDDYTGLADQLNAVGIESWVNPAPMTIDDVLSQLVDLGERVGRSDDAAALAQEMRSEIDAIVAATSTPADPLTYYHELDDSYFSVTSNTFIGSVYALFGLRNIADAAEANSDYPQLSAEFIVSQDPALIFLADTKCCAVTAESVAARPGWASLAAVQGGRVIPLDDDIASRWGPRIVEFVRVISEAVDAVGRASN